VGSVRSSTSASPSTSRSLPCLTDIAQGETPNWGGGLLNAIPFSGGFLGEALPFLAAKPKDQISGRQILENWGAPENKEGFHPIKGDRVDAFWDFAGLATEMLMAPPLVPGLQ
jgi:hypothetical protein